MGSELQVILNHNGVDIVADDEKFVSLTEIWKASGSDNAKTPARYLRNDHASEFISSLARNLKVQICTLTKVRRGKHLGGTWGHWQVAMAYAKWVNPDFHQAVNEGFRRWHEEEKNPGLKIDRGIEKYLKQGRSIEWVSRRVDGKVTRKELMGTMSDHNCKTNGKHDNPFAEATRSISLVVIGKTPSEFRKEKGLVKKNQLTRDQFTERELTRMKFAESEAAHMIRDEAADGNKECLGCIKAACEAVKAVIRSIDQRRRPAASA